MNEYFLLNVLNTKNKSLLNEFSHREFIVCFIAWIVKIICWNSRQIHAWEENLHVKFISAIFPALCLYIIFTVIKMVSAEIVYRKGKIRFAKKGKKVANNWAERFWEKSEKSFIYRRKIEGFPFSFSNESE